GKVHVEHIPNRKRKTLQEHVKAHVASGAELFTDELASYTGLDSAYVHKFVNHAEEYVRGNVHTNGIENFWSLLKRGLKGTYVAVEPFHLFRYVEEQVFRYNNRATKDNPLDDLDRFSLVVSQIANKRLTYRELTGKEGGTTAF